MVGVGNRSVDRFCPARPRDQVGSIAPRLVPTAPKFVFERDCHGFVGPRVRDEYAPARLLNVPADAAPWCLVRLDVSPVNDVRRDALAAAREGPDIGMVLSRTRVPDAHWQLRVVRARLCFVFIRVEVAVAVSAEDVSTQTASRRGKLADDRATVTDPSSATSASCSAGGMSGLSRRTAPLLP